MIKSKKLKMEIIINFNKEFTKNMRINHLKKYQEKLKNK